MKFPELFCCMM